MKLFILIWALIIVFFQNCPQETKFVASDLIEENLFTSGIEGPAVDRNGNIYAVNFQEQGTIGMVSPDGVATLFVKLPEGSIGNGIRLNDQGHLLIADYTQHNILRINPETKETAVYMHHPKMNQPNDLTITKSQYLFLSDPNWKEGTGNIWAVSPDGETRLLEEGMGTTNGIEVSPNDNLLYVNESVQRSVWVYDLSATGAISNKRKLIQFEDFGMDGMRCDIKGNIFITRHGKGTVAIVSPDGKLIQEVKLIGTKPSNITFGGPDGKTCYVTLQDRGCIEQFRAEFPGSAWSRLR